MSLQDWERDVVNRQRNIVFPDTNLNQGRFYRNIASGKAVYTFGQKVSLLVVVTYSVMIGAVSLANAIGQFMAEDNLRFRAVDLWLCAYPLGVVLFWIFLAVKGLFPAQPVRKRRGGYRRSGRV